MKKLPLDLLSTFVTFVESPNISAAAKTLGLSQPAVSVQLRCRIGADVAETLYHSSAVA